MTLHAIFHPAVPEAEHAVPLVQTRCQARFSGKQLQGKIRRLVVVVVGGMCEGERGETAVGVGESSDQDAGLTAGKGETEEESG